MPATGSGHRAAPGGELEAEIFAVLWAASGR